MSYWVAVKKGSYTGHSVIQHDRPTPETHPDLDYVVGPFDNEEKAEAYSKKEKNLTGTFNDPFCNDGKGR